MRLCQEYQVFKGIFARSHWFSKVFKGIIVSNNRFSKVFKGIFVRNLRFSKPSSPEITFFFIGLAVLGNCWHPHIELRFTYCRYITVDLHVSFFYNGSSLLLAAALYTYNHITNSSSGFFWLWILLSLPKLLNLQRRRPFGGGARLTSLS